MKISEMVGAGQPQVTPAAPFQPGTPAAPAADFHPTNPLDTPAVAPAPIAPVLPVPGKTMDAVSVPLDPQPAAAIEAAVATPAVAPVAGVTPLVNPQPAVALDTAPVATPAVALPAVAPAPAVPGAGGASVYPAGAVDINPAAKPAGSTAPTIIKGGFLMRGAQAQSAVAVEQAKSDLALLQQGFRFWIEVGGEARISFIDGILDTDGALAIPMWYEHKLMIGGRMTTITCYETKPDMGPCPVCQAGHNTGLVGALSIVNHTPYQVKKGKNAGKVLTNRRQMLVGPRAAISTLQIVAASRGGLATHCFDVYRKDRTDPRVGSVYNYLGQIQPEQIASLGEEWKPYNWDDEIVMLDSAEMAKLGAMAVPYVPQAQGATADLSEIEV